MRAKPVGEREQEAGKKENERTTAKKKQLNINEWPV
jgi:hypothetical protein